MRTAIDFPEPPRPKRRKAGLVMAAAAFMFFAGATSMHAALDAIRWREHVEPALDVVRDASAPIEQRKYAMVIAFRSACSTIDLLQKVAKSVDDPAAQEARRALDLLGQECR